MGLKERIAKEIIELKLNNAAEGVREIIQKLQQQFDEITSKDTD
jgi:hypothetical protein|tara:strand:- start:1034 stop:1165 length:132 start_codon:yes stop_codon:yes gene_type:complete